jgi:hypothetical protein
MSRSETILAEAASMCIWITQVECSQIAYHTKGYSYKLLELLLLLLLNASPVSLATPKL